MNEYLPSHAHEEQLGVAFSPRMTISGARIVARVVAAVCSSLLALIILCQPIVLTRRAVR